MAILSTQLFGLGCAEESSTDESIGTAQQALSGKNLFDKETFDGNGRTCGTCHMKHADRTMSPDDVQDAFADDPNGPLFRSIDSDDGVGTDYTLLKRDATVRIPITLPANITVDEVDSPNVRIEPDGRFTVFLRRGTPTVNNVFFENHLLSDGRASTLEEQVNEAVMTHNQPGRLATAEESSKIADFQRGEFTNNDLKHYANGGSAPELPHGCTESEQRGRTFFQDGPRGLCAMCHSGPLLNTTNAFNPIEFPGQRFSTNFSSEFNKNGYPMLTYRFQDIDGPRMIKSSDPGRSLISGSLCVDVPSACFINPGSGASIFKIPTLWGTPKTAPYFHDNSAKDIDELMDSYVLFFAITANGLGNPDLFISPQDRDDITAFLKLL